MKIRRVAWIALALLVLPTLVRFIWYYRGRYQPPELPVIQEFPVELPPLEFQPDVREPVGTAGRVLIDFAHRNNLDIDDIAPLRDRLVMYGATVEAFDGLDFDLSSQLVGATAYVVLAPTYRFTESELESILDFIADGGKLLMAADPTRPVPDDTPPGYIDLYSTLFPESAIPAVNSLANEFGVVYFDDYLYNLGENAGNYRDVYFRIGDLDHSLMTGVDEIILFASHSMRVEGVPLLQGDEDTLSPLRMGEKDLVAGALVADERVLALGDITFMQPSYHTRSDNDRFMSNIAAWLAEDEREWDVRDFPFLYSNPVALVQLAGEIVDPRLVNRMDGLRSRMEMADLSIELRESPESGEDALILGVFSELDQVIDDLTAAGIHINPPDDDEGQDDMDFDIDGADIDGEPEPSPINEVDGSIYVEGLGTFDIEGTTLFVEVYEEENLQVLVLAEDNPGAFDAVDRLIWSDYSNCVSAVHILICYSEDLADTFVSDVEGDGRGAAGNRVFILADDDSDEGVRTGAQEFEAVLEEFYTVTIWSTSTDGIPTSEDMAGHDVYIIDTGDFVYDIDDYDTYYAISEIMEPIMYIGAQTTYYDLEPAPVVDIEVRDDSHPIATGFELGEVIELYPSESGVPALVYLDEEYFYTETTSVIFARGPQSDYAGTPLVIAYDFFDIEYRLIEANLAFYRLPEEVQRTFALNAIAWLLGE
jgi:hypothetical protein